MLFRSLLMSMGSNTVNFKTSTGSFVALSNADMQLIVSSINDYVQTQFNWEMDTVNQINSASSIDDLQTIYSSSLGSDSKNA